MITSIANSVGEMTFISSPMFNTINSIRPRVFISTPSAVESRQSEPVIRAATTLPPNLPADATATISAHIIHCSYPLTSPICVRKSRVREECRQQQHDHDVFEAVRHLARHPAVVRNHGAERERPEHRMDADQFGGRRRDQQRNEYRRHNALRQPAAISVQQRQA